MHNISMRSRVRLHLAHCTPFRTCILTNLYRLVINAEDKPTAVNSFCYGFTDVFAKQSRQFPALIVLPTSDEIGNGIGTLTVKTNKKTVLTVNTELLLSAKTPKSINIPPEVLLIGTSGLFFKK